MTTSRITVGCRVAFSRQFLRNTGQYTGWAPFARGKVTNIRVVTPGVLGCIIADIAWDDAPPSPVNIANLVREDRIHLEPA
jgi:hypothetical protein